MFFFFFFFFFFKFFFCFDLDALFRFIPILCSNSLCLVFLGNIFLDRTYTNGKMNASGEELERINAQLAMEKGEEDTLLFDEDEV